MESKLAHCLTTAWSAMVPRKPLSVSDWADGHRVLTGKQSGERGPWRTRRTPFLREIMDCLSATSRVQDIVVMKSSQVGCTEATVNFIGYVMEHAPSPMMLLMPTLESRDAWKAQKLNPLLTDTPAIRDLLGGMRSRDAANRQDMIDFPGGVLFLAGGNSPNSYAQRSVRYIVMDDLDRFPPEVGAEGDPVRLAEGRTKAFARAKRILISTPTVADESLIEREWKKSDQRRYYVPCPHCGEHQPLEWGGPETPHGIKWSKVDGQILAAWYVCRACQGEIHDHHKPTMLAHGRWIAEHPERRARGYHLTALMAPVGLGPSWLDLAHEWQAAIKSPGTLRTFVNTHLGEPWVEQGDQVEATGLIARAEEYPEEGLADVKLARTAFCDVQKDRLECTVVVWGAGEECWPEDHFIVPGDTARPEVWETFAEELAYWSPEALGIDSGYNTSMVYAFCEKRRWAMATKGVAGPGRPLVEDERARRQRLRRQRKKGITVHMIGVDQGKALLYSRLRIAQPGPGYIHFPLDPAFDDEYFAQLTAEKLVTKIRGTRPYQEWVQTRARNEALDCFVGNFAVLRLAGINLEQRAKDKKNEPPATQPVADQQKRESFIMPWKPRRESFAKAWK